MAMIIKKKSATGVAGAVEVPVKDALEVTSVEDAPAPKMKLSKLKQSVPDNADSSGAKVSVEDNGEIPQMVVGSSYMSIAHKDGTEDVQNDVINPRPIVGQQALVKVEIGLTRNLGNFESLRISVGITLPCANDGNEVDATYAEAKAWCDQRIEQINDEVTEELGQS